MTQRQPMHHLQALWCARRDGVRVGAAADERYACHVHQRHDRRACPPPLPRAEDDLIGDPVFGIGRKRVVKPAQVVVVGQKRDPDSAWRISSRDGLGLSSRNAFTLIRIPGVQKPHCSP